jgi:protein-disulfide isomerase
MPDPDARQPPTAIASSGLSNPGDAAAPEQEEIIDDEFAVAPRPPHRDLLGSSPRRRRSRAAAFAAAVLIVAVAFGSGIMVGRATAPALDAAAGPSSAAGSGVAAAGSGSAAPSAAPGSSSPIDGLPSDGPLLGSAAAKVQLSYWADYQCPFCARFAKTVLPQLASRIADGTVSVLHRDFVFLGSESVDAAVAVRCVGEQGKYWPMHDAVYDAQNGENQGTFSTEMLTQLAAGVGADTTAFTACTQRHDVLVSVLSDTSAGVRAGVTSTPSIDIPGRRFLGVPDATALLAAVDAAAAAGAKPTPAPSVQPSGDPWAAVATRGLTAGASSAPVTVELWLDYQATGMPALAQTLEPGLRTRIASGKVQVTLRDLATLGDESVTAASFVRCAAQRDQAAVWFAHDILAVSARGAGAGVFNTRSLLWLAAKLGWDVTALDACMGDPATAAAVRAETAVGTASGLTVAPAVVVKVGNREVARFSGSSLNVAKVLAAVDAAAK